MDSSKGVGTLELFDKIEENYMSSLIWGQRENRQNQLSKKKKRCLLLPLMTCTLEHM